MTDYPAKFCIRCGTRLEEKIYHDNHLHMVCPTCDWAYFPDPKVAVAALIQQDGKILLVKRLFEPMQGYWALPAGFMNAEENPEQAAERECHEETGLLVKVDRLLTVITGRDHPRGADVVLVYAAHIVSGTVSASDDAMDAAFFPVDDLPSLAFRTTRAALDIALK